MANDWQTGQYYDTHPVTGEPGKWRYFPDAGGWVNVQPPSDALPDLGTVRDTGKSWNFLYDEKPGVDWVPANTEIEGETHNRPVTLINPETGEPGHWIWLGTFGWLNVQQSTLPKQDVPNVPFGGSVGRDSSTQEASTTTSTTDTTTPSTDTTTTTPVNNTATTTTPAATTTDFETTTTTRPTMGSGTSGAFTGTVSGLGYSPVQVPSMPTSSPKVDFVKLLNNMLAANVVGGMMTGRKV